MSRSLAFWLSLVLLPMPLAWAKSVVPPYELVQTKTGVPIYFFPKSNVPIFELSLAFSGGANLDPAGKSGTAIFSALMSTKGVTGLSENEIDGRLDDIAAGVSFDADDDWLTASGYGLSKYADAVVDLMFKELTQVTLPEKAYKRLLASQIERLRQVPDSAPAMANTAFSLIMTNDLPQARPVSGLIADLNRLKLSDIRAQRPALIRRDQLHVFLKGGSDETLSRKLLARVVEKIDALPCPRCGQPKPKAKALDIERFRAVPEKIILIDRPGVSEVQVRIGERGPGKLVKEYHDLRVAEAILGGYFSSRLYELLREKLGLAYGISAEFSMDRDYGAFRVSTSTATDKAVLLIQELKKALKEFGTGEISEEELKAAKEYLVGSFPLWLQNDYAVARAFFGNELDGMPHDFLDRYTTRLSEVSRSSVRSAIKKHFDSSRLITVVVGDAKALGVAFKAAGLLFENRNPKDFL